MGTHLIPRSDVKGQDRFFIFFSVPGLIGTFIGIIIGYVFYLVLAAMNASTVGIIIIGLFGAIGFTIGQVKVPDTNALPLFKKVGGEYIRDIILRFIKFRKNKKKFVNEVSSHQEFTVKDDKLDKLIMNRD